MRKPPVAGALVVRVTTVPAAALPAAVALQVCGPPDDQAPVLQLMMAAPVVDQTVEPATGLTADRLNVSAAFTKE